MRDGDLKGLFRIQVQGWVWHGISRSIYYEIRAQVLELGPVGATEPVSRRPHDGSSRTDRP